MSNSLNGADEENRTPVISLEGWGSTIELHPQLVDNINYTIFLIFVNRTTNFFEKNSYLSVAFWGLVNHSHKTVSSMHIEYLFYVFKV